MDSIGGRETAAGTPGQALVEFAFVAPVLIILLLGLAQFAMILEAQVGMANATRETARRAAAAPSVTCGWVLDEIKPASGTGLLSENVQAYQDARSTVSISFSSLDSSGATPFQTVTIDSSYRHPLFLPIIREIIDEVDGSSDSAFALHSATSMRLETPDPALDGATCTR
jgi:hypothetical protein